MRIRVKSNARKARASVRKLEKRMRALSPAMRVAAAEMDKIIAASFRAETGPGGVRWPALKPATKEARKRPGKKLQQTGRLRRSWRTRITPRGVRFVSDVPYAFAHQAGTRHLPARRMAPVQLVGGRWVPIRTGPAGAMWRKINRIMANYVAKGRVR